MRDLLDFLLSPFGLLILIGILGQFFGSEKRQKRAQEQARRRRQQRSEEGPTHAGGGPQKTEAEEIARRIREMMGLEKPQPKEQARAPEPPPAPRPAPVPMPTPEPRVRAQEPSRREVEQKIQWQVEGAGFAGHVPRPLALPPVSAPGIGLPGRHRRRGRVVPLRSALRRDPALGVAALLAIGPPRSLAPYGQDPLSSIHLRKG